MAIAHTTRLTNKQRAPNMQNNNRGKIDDETLLALHNAGKSTRQIEAITGAWDHSTIAKRLKHLTPRKSTEIFREMKADIFAEKQRKLLMSADKLSPKEQRDIAVAIGCYHDKEQQLRGNSSDGKPLVIINRISVGESIHRDQVIEVQTSQNNSNINMINAD